MATGFWKARVSTVSLTVLVAVLTVGALAVVVSSAADAAFPGTNGKIVFWSGRSAGPGLYTVTPGGTATRVPGHSPGENHAAWSPDGSRIAFMSASASNYEISVMNANGTGRRQITTTPVAEQEPVWSPDGSRIAFVGKDPGDNTASDLEIWVINVDGSGRTQLTNNTVATDNQPAWSPDGTQIAFVSARSGDSNRNIYMMDTNPTTDDGVSLTANSSAPLYQGHDDHPSWSPDGSQITYSNNGDGDADIYKMDTNPVTKDWTNLTNAYAGLDVEPAWSPDGSRIAYSRVDVTDGINNQNIYVMDTNGANKTSVDITLSKDDKPDWQPNPPTCDLSGDGDANTLVGTPANETICGLGGNDDINGGGGQDVIMGGDGNDTLATDFGFTLAPARTILNGGPGKDTAAFTGSIVPVQASLVTGFAQSPDTSPLEGAALVGIESMTGSPLDDELTGSDAANKLVGGDGADGLLGLGGKDTVVSRDGARNDTVNGGPGTDRCTTDGREISIRSCE